MPHIIALTHTIEDANTGGQATHHVVWQYSCQLHNNTSAVTMAGFVSQEAFDAGKRPLMFTTCQLNARPEGDCADWPDWFCRQFLALPDQAHPFAGASPVYAAEPAAEEPAA